MFTLPNLWAKIPAGKSWIPPLCRSKSQSAGPVLLMTLHQLKFQPDFPTQMEKKYGSDIVASALFLRPFGVWAKSKWSLNFYRLLSRCTVPGTAPRCKTQVKTSEWEFAAFLPSEATKATIKLIATELQSMFPPTTSDYCKRGRSRRLLGTLQIVEASLREPTP